MLKKLLLIITIFFLLFSNTFGFEVSNKTQKIYNNFIEKLEKKTYSVDKEINFLEILNKRLEKIKNLPKYRKVSKIQNFLNEILFLNRKQIVKLKIKKFTEEKKLKNNKTSNNNFKNKSNIVKTNNIYEKKFLEEVNNNKKIFNNYSFSTFFSKKIYNNALLSLENGVWYTYIYTTYSYFPSNVEITKKDLEYNHIDTKKSILTVKDGKLRIIRNYTKKRLISDYIIKDVENKYYFLKLLKDDLKNAPNKNYDLLFKSLKSQTKKITNNLTKTSKLQNIYNFVLTYLTYSQNINFNNYKLFSGIEAYKNKAGVCSAYVKLMGYMLLFSNISDIDVINGYVINAQDFPEIGHAWLRIENLYYDPTFDDPIGAQKDKVFKEYKYYALPKDLFYTNRYDENKLPQYLKKLSKEEREKIVMKNLYSIYSKYKKQDYNLLKIIKFRVEHNFSYDEKITINNFSKIIPKKILKDFVFLDNGKKKYIKSMKYYLISDSIDLETFVEQLNFDFSGKYFFERYPKNGTKKYIIAYDIKLK